MGRGADPMVKSAAAMPWGLQVLLASIVAAPAGFLGLVFLFSDVTTGPVERALWFGIHFFLPGFLIGLFFPRAWYVSVMVAWASMIFALGSGILALFSRSGL